MAVRDADELMVPAVATTVTALDPPDTDAALVCLARVTARTIDDMVGGQRGMMLGQTAPLLLKVLQELEDRSRKRRDRAGKGKPSGVSKLRAAHAVTVAKRTRAG